MAWNASGSVAAGASDVLVKVQNLSKQFGGRNPVLALDDVSLDVRKGEFISIVGPSGCGKTTLLRIIAGLESPTEGIVEFPGSRDPDIGFVFQEPNLMPWRTALSNAVLILELQGCEKEQSEARAQAALKLTGLAGYENFLPKDLSGGMKQRVAIARALVHDPAVLVMDEPFAALDVLTRTEMNSELRRIWLETGNTIIYVTHDLSEAVFLSQRVVVLTPQPGTVKAIVEITLPDERSESTRDGMEFVGFQKRIRELIGHRKPASDDRRARDRRTIVKSTAASVRGRWSHRAVVRSVGLLGVLVALLGLWKGILVLFDIPAYLVPPPEAVFTGYIKQSGGRLWFHTWITFGETIAGFLAGGLLGFFMGYALAKSRALSDMLMPYVVAAQTAPKIVFAPLMAIWFGFGMMPKVLLTMLIVFFPVLVNTVLGIDSIRRNPKELMRAAGATRFQTFAKLELPSILPEILAAAKTSVTLAVIGAVVGEFVGARSGLGWLAQFSAGYLDVTTTFVAILQLVLLGIALYLLVDVVQKLALRWREED